ncbi:MAG: hypothetical protein Q8R26_00285 [bacterium]|nr:hypothetical protein [bacterium]
MNYSFLRKIGYLRGFYKGHLGNTESGSMIYSAEPKIAQVVQDIKLEFVYLLGQATIVMLYSIWEGFVFEIQNNDSQRYNLHFKKSYEEYYNNQVKEVSLIRNCIAHNRGIIDKQYTSQSLAQTYKLGDEIKLIEQNIDVYFGAVEQAFGDITK